MVINVCAVGGIGEWPDVIAELPGADYNKIGAIAFFDQAFRLNRFGDDGA